MSKSELQDQGQALAACSTSELANWRNLAGEGKFGKEKVASGEGVERNTGVGKEINLTCDAVPVVDLADSSEEEIQEVEKEEIKEQEVKDSSFKEQKAKDESIKEQKVEDTSSKEQKVADILESLSNASREEQDSILSKMGIVRRIVKERDEMSDTLGLYSDGDEETDEGKVN